MINKPTTETVIAEILDSAYGMALNAREKYLFRESLYNLVRLAKAEQMLEIKGNVEKLTGVHASYGDYSFVEDESVIDHILFESLQRKFEFHEPE